MNVEQFSSALGKVNDKYIMEAITYERKKKSGWFKWVAMAACLTLMLAIGIPVVIDQTRPMGGEDIIEIKQVLK